MPHYELILGLLLALALSIFAFYGVLAVRHAARFRYLSRSTVYLSIFFVGASTVLIVACLFVYSTILFN